MVRENEHLRSELDQAHNTIGQLLDRAVAADTEAHAANDQLREANSEIASFRHHHCGLSRSELSLAVTLALVFGLIQLFNLAVSALHLG